MFVDSPYLLFAVKTCAAPRFAQKPPRPKNSMIQYINPDQTAPQGVDLSIQWSCSNQSSS